MWVVCFSICIAIVYERWADRRKMYNSLEGGIKYEPPIGFLVWSPEGAE
jgi:hypothetical protein